MAASRAQIDRIIKGHREAKAAFQALPEIVRTRLNAATDTTIKAIASGARMRILASPSVRTRALYNHIGSKINLKNGHGKVGVTSGVVNVVGTIITAHPIRPSRYAHLVEFGTVKMPAEPFMIPSADEQKEPYLRRCRGEGPGIEQDVAAIGLK